MLKLLILLLLLANGAYYAWSHGALAQLGLAPTHQAEPERLLVTPAASTPAPTSPPATSTPTN